MATTNPQLTTAAQAVISLTQQVCRAAWESERIMRSVVANDLMTAINAVDGDDTVVVTSPVSVTKAQLLAALSGLATLAKLTRNAGDGDNTLLGAAPLTPGQMKALVEKLGI